MARVGEVSTRIEPRFAFVLPHLLDKRKIGKGKEEEGLMRGSLPSVGVCAQREDKPCSALPASHPTSPLMEQALIVLNVDYSCATAP